MIPGKNGNVDSKGELSQAVDQLDPRTAKRWGIDGCLLTVLGAQSLAYARGSESLFESTRPLPSRDRQGPNFWASGGGGRPGPAHA